MTKVFRIFYSHSLVQNFISDQPMFKVCLVYSLQFEKLVGGTELKNCFNQNVCFFETTFRLTFVKKNRQYVERRKKNNYW